MSEKREATRERLLRKSDAANRLSLSVRTLDRLMRTLPMPGLAAARPVRQRRRNPVPQKRFTLKSVVGKLERNFQLRHKRPGMNRDDFCLGNLSGSLMPSRKKGSKHMGVQRSTSSASVPVRS